MNARSSGESLRQRQAQLLGNGELRRHRRGEVILQGVRIEGLRGAWRRLVGGVQLEVVPRQGGQRQRELIGRPDGYGRRAPRACRA